MEFMIDSRLGLGYFNAVKKIHMENDIKAKLMYPDPTKPAGLEFELPEDATVTIELFNESGKSVQTVFSQTPMKAGKQLLEFNKLGLNEGEYTLRISAVIRGEENRMTKKIYIEQPSNH